MKVKLKMHALWSIIENGDTDQQEEMMAFDALCGTVPPVMVSMITKKEMSKKAWDVIATMRVGDDRVKKTAQQLCQKFDLTTHGEEVKNGEIVMKMV
jgi:hypothetical protein